MNDYFDDFDDDFDEGEFMDDDSFEDQLDSEVESEDLLDQSDPIENEIQDDNENIEKFDIEDSFILGGAMGLAYEAGLNERERRRLLKKHVKEENQVKKQDDFH